MSDDLPPRVSRNRIPQQPPAVVPKASKAITSSGVNPYTTEKFMELCRNTFGTGSTGADPNRNVIRTHGFMGIDYMLSVRTGKQRDAFYDQYVLYATNTQVCLDEKPSYPYFIPFFDLDIKSVNPLSEADIMLIAKHVVLGVSQCFPGLFESQPIEVDNATPEQLEDPVFVKALKEKYSKFDPIFREWAGAGKGCNRLRCMVSLPTKPAGKTENGLYKDSVHMKWIGRLHVTVKEMLAIRKFVVMTLHNTFGPREKGENTWDEIVDEQVYSATANAQGATGSGGIRMDLSWKVEKCKRCKNQKKRDEKQYIIREKEPECPVKACRNGYVWIDRVYEPKWILNAWGEEDHAAYWIKDDPRVYIRAGSILSSTLKIDPNKDRFVLPEGIDLNSFTEDKIEKKKNAKPKKHKEAEKVKASEIKVKEYVDTRSPLGRMITEAIRQADPIHWFGIEFTRIQRVKEKQYKLQYPVNQEWCQCKKGIHTSNNIWFNITPLGIYQRCYSLHCENGNYGSKLKTPHYPIADELVDVLFHDVPHLEIYKSRPPRVVQQKSVQEESDSSDTDMDDYEDKLDAIKAEGLVDDDVPEDMRREINALFKKPKPPSINPKAVNKIKKEKEYQNLKSTSRFTADQSRNMIISNINITERLHDWLFGGKPYNERFEAAKGKCGQSAYEPPGKRKASDKADDSEPSKRLRVDCGSKDNNENTLGRKENGIAWSSRIN